MDIYVNATRLAKIIGTTVLDIIKMENTVISKDYIYVQRDGQHLYSLRLIANGIMHVCSEY